MPSFTHLLQILCLHSGLMPENQPERHFQPRQAFVFFLFQFYFLFLAAVFNIHLGNGSAQQGQVQVKFRRILQSDPKTRFKSNARRAARDIDRCPGRGHYEILRKSDAGPDQADQECEKQIFHRSTYLRFLTNVFGLAGAAIDQVERGATHYHSHSDTAADVMGAAFFDIDGN